MKQELFELYFRRVLDCVTVDGREETFIAGAGCVMQPGFTLDPVKLRAVLEEVYAGPVVDANAPRSPFKPAANAPCAVSLTYDEAAAVAAALQLGFCVFTHEQARPGFQKIRGAVERVEDDHLARVMGDNIDPDEVSAYAD